MFMEEYSLVMAFIIIGFICTLLLAVFVIIWIMYYMFFKERHKGGYRQYEISDIRQKNIEIAQLHEQQKEKKSPETKITAGILILPSRHKQKDVYETRPDYPESSPRDMDAGTRDLINIFNESASTDFHSIDNDSSFQCESGSQYHSDV